MGKGLFCLFLSLLPGKSLIHRAKANICQNCILKQLVLRILEYQPHLTSKSPAVIILRPHVFSIIKDLTACRLDQSIKMLDQG